MAGHRQWRVASPAGMGALTVLELTPAGGCPLWLEDRDGLRRAWPAPGRIVHGLLAGAGGRLDEVLCRGRADRVEVHLHGGAGILARVTAVMERGGWRLSRTHAARCPTSDRAAVAWASCRWGRLAGPLADSDRARAMALSTHAERLRRPAVVRLVGRPNAGKSTLFNALIEQDRSLVAPMEGTTRDTVSAIATLEGVPVRWEDWAGSETPSVHSAPCDLRLHLLSSPAEVPWPGADVLAVGGQADRRGWPADRLAVSGRDRRGLPELCQAVAVRLGIEGDREVDSWTPIDRGVLARLLVRP